MKYQYREEYWTIATAEAAESRLLAQGCDAELTTEMTEDGREYCVVSWNLPQLTLALLDKAIAQVKASGWPGYA